MPTVKHIIAPTLVNCPKEQNTDIMCGIILYFEYLLSKLYTMGLKPCPLRGLKGLKGLLPPSEIKSSDY